MNRSCTRVASRPTRMMSRPVAMGSNVPAWPTLASRRALRTRATTSNDVNREGLSTSSAPGVPGAGKPSARPKTRSEVAEGSVNELRGSVARAVSTLRRAGRRRRVPPLDADLREELVQTRGVLGRLVEEELELGHALELVPHAAGQGAPDLRRQRLQALERS